MHRQESWYRCALDSMQADGPTAWAPACQDAHVDESPSFGSGLSCDLLAANHCRRSKRLTVTWTRTKALWSFIERWRFTLWWMACNNQSHLIGCCLKCWQRCLQVHDGCKQTLGIQHPYTSGAQMCFLPLMNVSCDVPLWTGKPGREFQHRYHEICLLLPTVHRHEHIRTRLASISNLANILFEMDRLQEVVK